MLKIEKKFRNYNYYIKLIKLLYYLIVPMIFKKITIGINNNKILHKCIISRRKIFSRHRKLYNIHFLIFQHYCCRPREI